MTSAMFMSSKGALPWAKSDTTPAGGILLLIGIFLAVATLIFLWAAYVRKPRRRHHSHHHTLGQDYGESSRRHRESSGFAGLFGRKHRRRRTRRRDRPVNPTLAQVGGLPPRRDPEHPQE